ncbi:hypothetical protein [Aeoliella sp.]|uniref:hypothetical protein n=1 Tax=Aeoliella sp. TaxID=2795800 RepID=UPI003CCBBFD6
MRPTSESKRPFFVLLILAAATTVSQAEPLDKPYSVWIGPTGAKVFSGPGDDYYATQRLPEGTECQVYEELRDGWLAIRPPEGSYSLVLASALGEEKDGVAEVRRDSTPSRIGSVINDSYSSVHVRLERGELVQVLDKAASRDTQWATIAPPAGEFRWVRKVDVTQTAPRRVATLPGDDSGNDWRGIEVQTADDPNNDQETIRVVAHDEPEAPTTDAAPLPQPQPTETPLAADAPFTKKLDRLEIQLSRRVAGPVNLWRFDDLEREAATLLSQATSASEQQAVTSLAGRMSRFSAIGERYRNAAPSTNTSGVTQSIATADAPITPDPALGQFDAVGVLRPVVSKNGNAPPYALVDDSGQVVTFITPSPSLNLQQLLGQRVGVSGTRGFLPEYRSRNIQTARVAPVDGTLRR